MEIPDSRLLPEGVQRVAAALQRLGHPQTPVMLDDAARTAQQAADALGVALGQIAKSIIFRRKPDGVAVLVVTSGDRRVCEDKVAALVCAPPATGTDAGHKLGRANADFVKAATGFSIGGVSPLAHTTPPITLIDRELFRFAQVWAAAGHPHAVFSLSPQDLVDWTGAPVADVVQDVPPAVTLAAARLRQPQQTVPSPCIGVCKMVPATGWCSGCFRSIDEITRWSRLADDDKLALWQHIEARQATAPTPTPAGATA